MKHFVQTAAIVSTGAFVLLLTTISNNDNTFASLTSIGFLVTGLALLFAIAIIVTWATIVEYSSRLSQKWPIRCLVVRNYPQEMSTVWSFLFPIALAFLVASETTRERPVLWIRDMYEIAIWIVGPLALISAIAMIHFARREGDLHSHDEGEGSPSSCSKACCKRVSQHFTIKNKLTQKFKVNIR